MENREMIKVELAELLEKYYSGSFSQMACGYIRLTGMTEQEVGQMLEEIRKVKKVDWA